MDSLRGEKITNRRRNQHHREDARLRQLDIGTQVSHEIAPAANGIAGACRGAARKRQVFSVIPRLVARISAPSAKCVVGTSVWAADNCPSAFFGTRTIIVARPTAIWAVTRHSNKIA